MVKGNNPRLAMRVADLPGIGKRRAEALAKLGVLSVTDLLRHAPMRYEKEAAEGSIDDLPVDGKTVGSARGEVKACRWVAPKGYGRKGRFEATLRNDESRKTLQLTWFNAAYLRERILPGYLLRVQGKAKLFNDYPQIINPKWERLDPDQEAAAPPGHAQGEGRLRPVYPGNEAMGSVKIERLLDEVLPWALPLVVDPLPADLVSAHAMPELSAALRMIHRPASADEHKAARRRLAFNELLLLQLGIALRRAEVDRRYVAPALRHSDAIDRHIRGRFPFELTDTQAKAVGEIAGDLSGTRPMNRMLQGDVGAGKTIVALYALLMAVADRRQGALMAPTELLAEQHYLSIKRILDGADVRVALLTGQQRDDVAAIASGQADLIVGTHALLSASVDYHDLAVVVIDEQHRFGVVQRAALRQVRSGKAEPEQAAAGKEGMPHTLVMTATPIPRTLSLTLFGDLEHSTLTGLPPGRTPIQNRVVMPQQADEVYRYLQTRLARGEQVYVVVPAIESSQDQAGGSRSDPELEDEEAWGRSLGLYEDGGEAGGKPLKNVNDHAKDLKQKFFPEHTVATVHGKMKRETRQRVMERFRRGQVDVLVATTVIEVGVDVPNATVMVVEHAERFGLAQLHQLRGRVGRGDQGRRSLCVFIADPTTDDAAARMEAIASTNDGFKIAELDLQIRGMGELLGVRQSGMPPLRMADLGQDLDLLGLARRDAEAVVAADPKLEQDAHALLRKVLLSQYGDALGLVDVG